MYTLRIIEETRKTVDEPFQQVVENFYVGSSYSILRKGLTKEFNEIFTREFPEKSPENIDALLICDSGRIFFIEHMTDLMNYTYYIMTDNGKTFERL